MKASGYQRAFRSRKALNGASETLALQSKKFMHIEHEPTILLVEDSDEDYAAMRRVIGKGGWKFALHRCPNAEDALALLRARDEMPDLILLDLNLPGMDGRELLAEIKSDERLKTIPVVALTTSANPRDVIECYRSGANSYQIKQVNYEKFFQSMQTLFAYWLKTATLPAFGEKI